jgi:hypothetical protein
VLRKLTLSRQRNLPSVRVCEARGRSRHCTRPVNGIAMAVRGADM